MKNKKVSSLVVLFCTWIGELNASVNLALRKNAVQSSILDGHGPDLAVDGIRLNSVQFGQQYCVQTQGHASQVWWQVDLGQNSQIKTISVVYRHGFNGRLPGIRFYISTDRNWWTGRLCYKNDPKKQQLPIQFDVNCAASGRYVTIYNDRNGTRDAYLDLCEVEVYGCPLGKYGHGDCRSDCQGLPQNCKTCHPDSGICSECKDGTFGLHCNGICQIPNCKSCQRWNGTTCSVCQDGFAGATCQECTYGRFGRNCELTCPNCFNGQCERVTGVCNQGCNPWFNGSNCSECEDGRHGLYCESFCQLQNCKACNRKSGRCTKCKDDYTGPQCQSCIVGKHGFLCSLNCPSNCQDTCDRNTGNCNKCKDGWGGLRCQECASGRHGQFCHMKCPDKCLGGQCDRPSGQCTQGCNAGWKGNLCHDCADGYFGITCTQMCHCKYGTCDKNSGICLSSECVAGYMGQSCNIRCPIGTFGSGCTQQCHCQFQTCDSNGRCPGKCKAGYTGSTCSQSCLAYTYGLNCASRCNCLGGPCNKETGQCPVGGCSAGYHGFSCSKECEDGRFGSNCNETCHCLHGSCNKVNGQCHYNNGCSAGYQGTSCSKKCDYGQYGSSCSKKCFCRNKTCDHVNGRCPSGECENGYLGPNCDTLCRDGFFGPRCNMTCYCASGPCNKSTGQCPPGGCKGGWQGSTCNQICSDGYYGDGCKDRCYCKSGPCDSFTGQCINGVCHDGYRGAACSNVCVSGTFGPNCSIECHCKNRVCAHDTGVCPLGICQNGWFGRTCSQECPFGRYGTECKFPCGNCINQRCNPINGSCINGCQEGWRGLKCDTRVSAIQQLEGQTDKMIPIFAGAIVGVLLVISVIVIIIFVIRRRHQKRNPGMTVENASRNLSMENLTEATSLNIENSESMYTNAALSTESESEESLNKDNMYQNTNDYYNVKAGKDINIAELRNLIKWKLANDTFTEEYHKLPSGLIHPHVVSLKPENKSKNRFISVFCYDHSRVILEKTQDQDEIHSDYIHASYIDGVDIHREYIATQGPRKNTVSDFWRMIWERKCNKIVMLTGLVEGGKVKCERYWPLEDKPLHSGCIQIDIKNEHEYAFYTNRILKITNKNTKEIRLVSQYHFTTWPDHGTPDPLQLVVFHRHVNEDTTASTGPLVVHCSAGIGRTGTFIALDALYKFGLKTERIDLFEYVKTMRKDRMNMIQTLDQYIFLHDVLLEAFSYKDTTIRNENFLQVWKEIQEGPKNQNRIRIEFQELQSERPTYSQACYRASLDKANVDKNRGTIHAHDKYRPFLISYNPTRNNYINAVYLPSFKRVDGYIATHYPLETTVVDLWCLIYDHSNKVVIFDNKKEEMSWLPSTEEKELQIDPFTVAKISENTDANHITEMEISIHHKKKSEKKVKVLLASVPSTESKSSYKDVYLKLSDFVGSQMTPGSVTVVCPDGASHCGIFCATNSILQRIQLNKEVDTFHTVKELQRRRPEMFDNFEQYQLCYEIIKDYFNSDTVYMNT